MLVNLEVALNMLNVWHDGFKCLNDFELFKGTL